MDDIDQFSIVPGARPDAIITGPLDILMQHIPQSAALVDAEERLARVTQEADTKSASLAHGLKVVTDFLKHIADRVTRITKRVDEVAKQKAERARRDAEAAEAKRVQEMLDRLPDPDAVPDDGDLQSPKTAPAEEQRRAESFGDLPEDIRKRAPSPHLGPDFETSISKLTNPKRPQEQPAAISLNAEV